MNNRGPWYERISIPALLRHARSAYGSAMRRALEGAGYGDIPKNGLYVIGGLELGAGDAPLGRLIAELRISKQAAGQLIDTLVMRGYLERTTDPLDRRRLIVALTERGKAAAAVQTAARQQIDDELAARIGERAARTLQRALAALIEIHREREREADTDPEDVH